MVASTDMYDYFKNHDVIMCAYHEAGHAIYGLLHFFKVEKIHLFFDKKTKTISGLTSYYYPCVFKNIKDKLLYNELIQSDVCINYAGLIVERQLYKNLCGSDAFPGFWKTGSSSDTKSASDLFKKYKLGEPGKARLILKKKFIADTQIELKKFWKDVILLSHLLFKKKKIFFLDIKNLFIKKSENKMFWKKQFKTMDFLYENESVKEETLKLLMLNNF